MLAVVVKVGVVAKVWSCYSVKVVAVVKAGVVAKVGEVAVVVKGMLRKIFETSIQDSRHLNIFFYIEGNLFQFTTVMQ